MMFNKNLQIFDLPEKTIDFFCDGCRSEEIIESGGGYVCRNCGLTLDLPIFQYNSPYNQDSIQVYSNELKKTTKLGTNLERRANSRSCELERMSKMQRICNEYSNLVLQIADSEFNRIITALHLPNSLKIDCIFVFKNVWKNLKKGTKGRSAEKLVPVILFMVLKVKAINFDFLQFKNILNVSKNDFKEILMESSRYYPAYAKRDRKQLILKKINEICEFFNFNNDFGKSANIILRKFWPFIKNTKDDVIAGVVTTLALIAKDINSISISRICDKIGIKMSTINYQVKNHIFVKKKISGFKSLVNSSDLIKEVVEGVVFDALIIKSEIAQDLSVGKEIEESDASEIVIIDLKNEKEHHFNVSLEDFRDIIPFNLHSEPLKFTINCYHLTFLKNYTNIVNKSSFGILKLDKKHYRRKCGKGPPILNS